MNLTVNKRGHLIRPASRFLHLLQSFFWSVALTYGVSRLNGFDFEEFFSMPLFGVLAILAGLILGIISWLSRDLEFDSARKCVVQGRKIVAKYSEIYKIEIRQSADPNADRYRVCLRLGATRVFDVLHTNSETDASFNAATVAREIGKEVALTDDRGNPIAS